MLINTNFKNNNNNNDIALVNYWDDNSNRRKFFEDFSKLKGFNPKQADEWYRFEQSDFESDFPKEARAMFSRFPWPEALYKAFNDVKFDKSRIKVVAPTPHVDFSDPLSQKTFFGIL